ncbi:MAG: class IV adenylate cyclase [Planctomycetales bacterium]|nr:class IV adenylate cyclase [Planctomycetales bacterium]
MAEFEVEQKFALVDSAEMQQRLAERGAAFGQPQSQADRYFAHPGRDFASTDEALRIRSTGEANCITYKGPKLDAATKTRREIELPLAPGAAAAEEFGQLLTALGFTPVAVVRKIRRTARFLFGGRQFEAALDEVENVGRFIELETAADAADLDAARAALLQLAQELGLASPERRSYLELLLAGGG